MTQKRSPGMALCIVMLFLFLTVAGAWAQSGNQGTLTVTVQDKTGGVVPEAKLVLKDKSTNDVREASTLASGTYNFVGLNVGLYSLTIYKSGYKDLDFQTVVLHASRVTDLNAVLEVGAVTEKVEIVAEQAPIIETTSNVLGTTIDLKQIEYLPMDDRDPTALAYFMPGVASGYFNNQQHQAEINSLDGVIGNSSRMKAGGNIEAATTPRLQNVEEITIQTSGLEANQGYGQAAMQAVLTTRRGSNNFHGRLFSNLQNSSLNANTWYNDYYSIPKPLFHKEDFGGSLGGPIWKNKIFFFFAYEQDDQPGKGSPANTVMTPALQQGNYTYQGSDGSTQTINLFSLAQAAGLPAAVDSGIAAELSKINGSLSGGTLGRVGGADDYESKDVQLLTFHMPNNIYDYYPTFRVDYNVRDNLRVNLAVNETKADAPTSLFPTYPGSNFTWQQDGTKSTAYTAAIGVDWIIKPTLVNQFQGGYLYNFGDSAYKSRANNYNMTHDIVWWNAPWGLNYNNGAASGDFFYSGISSFYPLFSFNDNLVWQHKTHSFTFGGSFYREQDH